MRLMRLSERYTGNLELAIPVEVDDLTKYGRWFALDGDSRFEASYHSKDFPIEVNFEFRDEGKVSLSFFVLWKYNGRPSGRCFIPRESVVRPYGDGADALRIVKRTLTRAMSDVKKVYAEMLKDPAMQGVSKEFHRHYFKELFDDDKGYSHGSGIMFDPDGRLRRMFMKNVVDDLRSFFLRV